MTEERWRCLIHKSGARDGKRKRVEKGGDGRERVERERREGRREEGWARERADTGFAWSVRLVGKTTGRGRLQHLTLVCVCVCVCWYCMSTSVVRPWISV